MKMLALIFCITIALNIEMAHAAVQDHGISQQQMAPRLATSPAKHVGVGVLTATNATAGKVQISHEAIPDLGWPPMTMWFALRDALPQDIKVGDTVSFELMQGENKQWEITKIGRK